MHQTVDEVITEPGVQHTWLCDGILFSISDNRTYAFTQSAILASEDDCVDKGNDKEAGLLFGIRM